jgi:uncharacterized protein YndB with AHSA1/START domain
LLFVDLPDISVERSVELDASPEDVWANVCAPQLWLADDGYLDVRPGGTGRLTDAGVRRLAIVETVDPGRRLVYRWWPDRPEGGASASRVEITVEPSDGPTRLVVRETPLLAPLRSAAALGATASLGSGSPAGATGDAARVQARLRSSVDGLRWDVRLLCLQLACLPLLVPVRRASGRAAARV